MLLAVACRWCSQGAVLPSVCLFLRQSSQKALSPRALARGAIAKACERLLLGSSCSIATAAAAFSSSRHFVLQLRLDDHLAVANGTTSFVADVVATMALQ